MKILYSAKTDTGVVRKENQDAYGVNAVKDFFIVCDGMGGGAAGDFASKCAVDVMLRTFDKLDEAQIKAVIGTKYSSMDTEILRPAATIMLANRMLNNLTLKYPKLFGMGTTAVAIRFEAEKGLLHVYHSGDSRLYRVRSGVMELITKDHSKVNELIDEGKMTEEDVKTAEMQSMITRALGTGATIKVDYKAVAVRPGDQYVMCSDGLNGEIDDFAIKGIIDMNRGNLEAIAEELIAAANNSGGRDNTTVIALKIEEDDASYNPTKDYVEEPITITEEVKLQSLTEDKILSQYEKDFTVPIPESAQDNNFFTKPLFLGSVVALAVIILVIVLASMPKHKKAGKELHEITGNVSGIVLDVRTAKDDHIDRLSVTFDRISRMEIIREIVLNTNSHTLPLLNAQVSIEEKGGGLNKFIGVSSDIPLEIKLPKGAYTMTIVYPGYRILDNRYNLVDFLDLILELSGELKKEIIIMLPEKTEE
ncbi:MAG: protein phosphatase 2C domain-containing protein [Endomicrobia bacterium]|nr:protein phosphatase 2C domain-containing protein [Endomicrobiia bacterium]